VGIEVHTFRSRGGSTYCLDVVSSAVIRADEVMRDLLAAAAEGGLTGGPASLADRHRPEEIGEALAELEDLQRRGYFRPEPDPEAAVEGPDPLRVELKGVSLFVAGDCNLACRYCYNHGGACEGDELASMPLDVARRAVDLLLSRSEGRVTCTFFGGEPLLHPELIESVVAYCEGTGRPFDYSLTTNGTVLDDRRLAFLSGHAFRVLVSYDGDRQPQQRPSRDGRNNRELVRRNIRALASAIPRDKLTVRCTVTSATREIGPLIEEARELGVRLGLGAVTLPAAHPWTLSRADFQRVMEQEERLRFDELLAGRDAGRSPLAARWTRFVDQILEGRKRHYSCGVGVTVLAVGTKGDLYPCHRFVGDARFRMGTSFRVSTRTAGRSTCVGGSTTGRPAPAAGLAISAVVGAPTTR
jgi:uncharacterized protein